MQTIEKVLSARNLTEASVEVIKNKGAAGVDGMSVKQLKAYLETNRESITRQIRQGEYIPSPIRGKEIPKRNGKKRKLGIPTVIDRMLQQAVTRVIMPQFEYMFSEYSYGFIHKVYYFKGVHELAPLGSATTEYATSRSKNLRVHQFRIPTYS